MVIPSENKAEVYNPNTMGEYMNKVNYINNTFSVSVNVSGEKNKSKRMFKFTYGEYWKTQDLTIEELMTHIKKGYAWMPSLLDGSREKDNVVSSELLVFDFDKDVTLDEILELPIVQKYAALVHTSTRHTEDWHRFRLIFRLPKTLTDVDEIDRLLALAFCALPKCDQQAKDATRFYYGNENAEIKLLNPDAVLPEDYEDIFAAIVTEKLALQTSGLNPVEKMPKNSEQELKYYKFKKAFKLPFKGTIPLEVCISKSNRALIEEGAKEGSRNGNGFKVACDLIGVSAYLDSIGQAYSGTPRELFEQYCQRCDQEDWNQSEWEQIFSSASKGNKGGSLSENGLEKVACSYFWKQQSFGNRQMDSATELTHETMNRSSALNGSNPELLSVSDTYAAVKKIIESDLPEWQKIHEYSKVRAQSELRGEAFKELVASIENRMECGEQIDRNESSLLIPSVDVNDIFLPILANPMRKDAKKLNIDPMMIGHNLLPIVASLLQKNTMLDMFGIPMRPVIWTLTVADSGAGKTRAFNLVKHPLEDKQIAATEAYKIAEKEWLLAEKEAQKAGETLDADDRPTERKFVIQNATLEGLMKRLSTQETHGTVEILDEALGALKDAGKYSGGRNGDKEQYLATWDCPNFISFDRAGEGKSVFVKAPRLSRLGGTQPGVFRQFFADENDSQGFGARYLMIAPKKHISAPVPAYCDLADFLPKLYENVERLGFGTIKPTNEAYELWQQVVVKYGIAGERERESLKNWMAKAAGHLGRVALLLHVLECAVSPQKDLHVLTLETMTRACVYLDYCHRSYAYLLATQSPTQETDEIAAKLLRIAEQRDGITAREAVMYCTPIKRIAREKRRQASTVATEILQELALRGKGEIKKMGKTSVFFAKLKEEERSIVASAEVVQSPTVQDLQQTSEELHFENVVPVVSETPTETLEPNIVLPTTEPVLKTTVVETIQPLTTEVETPLQPLESPVLDLDTKTIDGLALEALEAQKSPSSWANFSQELRCTFNLGQLKELTQILIQRIKALFNLDLVFQL